jgi:hypothetical protein
MLFSNPYTVLSAGIEQGVRGFRTNTMLSLFIVCLSFSVANAVQAATAPEIDAQVNTALTKFRKELAGADEYLEMAKGICRQYTAGVLVTAPRCIDHFLGQSPLLQSSCAFKSLGPLALSRRIHAAGGLVSIRMVHVDT